MEMLGQARGNAHWFSNFVLGIICANSPLAKASHMTELSVKGWCATPNPQ